MFLVSVYETLTIVFSILFVIVAVACILLVIPIFKGKRKRNKHSIPFFQSKSSIYLL